MSFKDSLLTQKNCLTGKAQEKIKHKTNKKFKIKFKMKSAVKRQQQHKNRENS